MKSTGNVLVAVKDRATETFHAPLVFKHNNEAIRWFTWLLNEAPTNDNNAIMKHNPEDYDLWFLGIWDEVTGTMIQDQQHEKLIDGKTVATQKGI